MLLTGQVITGTAPVAECIRGLPRPTAARPAADDGADSTLPGGAGRTALHHNVRRGVGFAVGFKNLMFSEGFDDYSTARVRLELGPTTSRWRPCTPLPPRSGRASSRSPSRSPARCSASTTSCSRRRTPRSVRPARPPPSRQTWMSGGAVHRACAGRPRGRSSRGPRSSCTSRRPTLVARRQAARSARRHVERVAADAAASRARARRPRVHHAPTDTARRGRAGQRARVASRSPPTGPSSTSTPSSGWSGSSQVTTAQDVGRALNPLQVTGQIEGGIAQGVGLAVMEEIVVDGRPDPEPVVHRLPAADAAGHAPRASQTLDRAARARRAVRRQRAWASRRRSRRPRRSPLPSAQRRGLPLNRIPIRPQDIALASRPPSRPAEDLCQPAGRSCAARGGRVTLRSRRPASPPSDRYRRKKVTMSSRLRRRHRHRRTGQHASPLLPMDDPWPGIRLRPLRLAHDAVSGVGPARSRRTSRRPPRSALGELALSGCTSAADHHYLVPARRRHRVRRDRRLGPRVGIRCSYCPRLDGPLAKERRPSTRLTS